MNHAARTASSALASHTITISGPDAKGIWYVQQESSGLSMVEPYYTYASAVRYANVCAEQVTSTFPGDVVVINDLTTQAQQSRDLLIWAASAIAFVALFCAAYATAQ